MLSANTIWKSVRVNNSICSAFFANSAAAFDAVTRTYLHPGLEALSCLPAALHFDISATVAGARVVYPKIKDIFEPGMAEIVSAITPRTRVIYLPNPNSVSGASFTEAEIVFLLAYAENTMVLVDESYFEFCNLTVIDLVRRFSNVIIFRTFSKAFALAGLGTSYIVTDPRNLTFINLPGYHKEPDVIAQAAAQTAIDDINYVMEYVRQVNESKKMLYENLTRLNYNFRITPANFLLLKTADPDELANMFRNNQILVNNLDNVPGFENYLRITIGTPSQTGILLDILAKSAGHRKPGDYSRKRAFAKV